MDRWSAQPLILRTMILAAAMVQAADIALSWAATNTGMYDDLCLAVFGSWPATIALKSLAFILLYLLIVDEKSNWVRVAVGAVLMISIGAFTHNLILLASSRAFLS